MKQWYACRVSPKKWIQEEIFSDQKVYILYVRRKRYLLKMCSYSYFVLKIIYVRVRLPITVYVVSSTGFAVVEENHSGGYRDPQWHSRVPIYDSLIPRYRMRIASAGDGVCV